MARAAALLAVSLLTTVSATSPVAAAPVPVAETRAALRGIDYSPRISTAVSSIARGALDRFKDRLSADDLAIAVIVDGEDSRIGGFHLDREFYPASVIKLAYSIALEKDFQRGTVERSSDVLRDLDLMLKVSSNAATNRILDRLTGTESGPELPEDELALFAARRQAVNSYLRELGLSDINACQKTWDDRPFGRDRQFLGPNYENRNMMTAAETARLMWLIKHDKVVGTQEMEEVLSHLKRRPGSPRDIQARRIGAGIPSSSDLWSKAGWTSDTNHDCAYVDLPMGNSYVLVIFTNTSYKEADILSWITREITSAIQLGRLTPEWIGPSPATVGRGIAGGR